LAKSTLGVDEEETAKGNTLVLEKNTVVAGDAVGLVAQERKLDVGANATLVSVSGRPVQCKDRKLRKEEREEHVRIPDKTYQAR
jgi:hypothetical protein